MQRIVNFRAFLFIFVGAIIGIVFSLFIIEKSFFALIFAGIFSLVIFVFIFIRKILKKNTKFDFINKFLLCIFIGFIFFLTISFVNYRFYNYNLEDTQACTVSARVCNKSEKTGLNYLILENATIKNLQTDKTSELNGKISLIIYSEDYLDSFNIGDIIFFKGSLVKNSLIKDGKFNSYYYKNNIKYSCFINESEFTKTNGELHLDEKIRGKVKEILFSNLSYDNASIAYSVVFGDKTMLDNNILDSFSLSGTAHLLCVSGLHVGFIVAILYFIFNLLKIKRKFIFIILTILLGLYSYLCGFSPSVVRASIMSIVLAGSACFGNYRYDNLSSLSFAGLTILLINPFMIFDVGFQLSFSSCFGIFLLMPVFTKLFKKINFYNKFSQIFSLTLSAQIGTFPILLNNFEKLSFLSVIANIIIVPIFSILFMFLIVSVMLNFLLPFGFIFKIIEIGLNFIILLTKTFGGISECIYYSNGSLLIANIFFYLSIIFISGYMNIKNIYKIVNVLICAVIVGSSFLVQFLPNTFTSAYIITSEVDAISVVTSSYNQKVLVITDQVDLSDYATLKTELLHNKILKIDAVILSYYSANSQEAISKICNNYSVENIFLPSSIDELSEKYLAKKLRKTLVNKVNDNYVSFSDFTFKILNSINTIELNLLDKNGFFNILFTKSYTKAVATYLTDFNKAGDYFITNFINKKYITNLNGYNSIICKNNNVNQINVFNISKINGKIKLGEEIKYAF